jgi:CysZ protein
MFTHIEKALSQIFDPGFRGVLLKALALTVALFAAVALGAQALLALIPPFDQTWLNAIVQGLVGLGLVIGSVFLILPVAAAVAGLFLDDVAAAVEGRHFPGLSPRRQGMGELALVGLRLAVVLIVVNLMALPLYLLLPGLNLMLYILINGYLVGREYFELAALRHRPAAEVRRLRKRHGWRILGAGAVVAAVLLIPLVNLLAPLFGTALMVHVAQDIMAREGHR